jgi:hypothetical protein
VSGLDALLAGSTGPGVFRWRGGHGAVDVRRVVEGAGWRLAVYDGWSAETRAEVLDGLGRALDLPTYYGQNLDALADCLRSVVPAGRSGTVLLWDGWGPFARADRRAFSATTGVLRARADDGGAPFAVLLRGGGPTPPGVPDLW